MLLTPDPGPLILGWRFSLEKAPMSWAGARPPLRAPRGASGSGSLGLWGNLAAPWPRAYVQPLGWPGGPGV